MRHRDRGMRKGLVLRAGVALLVAAPLLWLAGELERDAPASSDASRLREPAPPTWLRASPPPLLLPPGPAFDHAIAPWQAGNYGGAAYRLDLLAGDHPDLLVLHFYRGVAWLLAGVPHEAVAPLSHVVSVSGPGTGGQASWYLGLALLDTGRDAEALSAFDAACTAGHRLACRAVAAYRSGADR